MLLFLELESANQPNTLNNSLFSWSWGGGAKNHGIGGVDLFFFGVGVLPNKLLLYVLLYFIVLLFPVIYHGV